MIINEELKSKWEDFQKNGKSGLMETLGIRITGVHRNRVTATMPAGHHNQQPFGYLHGGASVSLAESIASLGSWMIIDEKESMIFGLEISATHLRSVSKGSVQAEAELLHRGKSIHVWNVQITDEQKRMICISRCTIAVRPKHV